MNAQLNLLLTALLMTAVTPTRAQMNYPATRKMNQVDTLHGVAVADPYRWFENDTTQDVKNWVKAENRVTFDYLAKIPFREQLRKRMNQAFSYERYSQPDRAGEYYLFAKNTGLQPQNVVYVQKGLQGKPEVFLDPNTLSKDGTTRVSPAGLSKDNRYMGIRIQKAGSDWGELVFMEIATKRHLPDTLRWIKNGNAAWRGDGIYYSRYPEPAKGKELTALNEDQQVYYHKLGTPQSADQLVYEDRVNLKRFHYAQTTEDERFLLIYSFQGNNNRDIYCQDLTKPGSKLELLIRGKDNTEESVLDNDGDALLLHTNRNAPNGRIVRIDTKNPAEANWQTIVAEKPEAMTYATTVGGKLFVHYLKDVTSRVYQHDYTGKREREIKLPDLGSAYGFGGKREDKSLFYTFLSNLYPPTIFRYDIATGQSTVFKQPKLPIDVTQYESEQVFYPSKDGTKIPMFLVHKKGVKRDGKQPVLLYGYGGYGITMSPSFSPIVLVMLEQGMTLAVANIRGGGEYGEKWHQAGMLLNTQNRFDDFIAAAEYLIRTGYTAKDKLSMFGGSHGGCLVATVMTQRPDLFKVAVPVVGTLDMLRFHKFTVGWNWVREYGHPDSLQYFKLLYGYSPVHNVKAGVQYPATLVMTADHDDRVVPMHSFKFISELQAKQTSPNPVLIRIDTNSGHGGSSLTKTIDDFSDMISFILYNFGIKPQFSAESPASGSPTAAKSGGDRK